jgi:UDP-N-acetylmuramate--alanine ligase
MLKNKGRAFFIGVGGSGMSSLAHILLDYGWEVYGQDKNFSPALSLLESRGLKVIEKPDFLEQETFDFAIYSSAINKTQNPYYLFFSYKRIPLIHRSELMHQLFSLKKSIAVAGSHGKTTTTAMIATILLKAGYEPAIMVGGEFSDLDGKGGYFGKGDWGVYESDESDGTFLSHKADIQVITNIDNDHLDFYKTEDNLFSAFQKFLELKSDSKRIVSLDDIGVKKLLNKINETEHFISFSEDPHSKIKNHIQFKILGRTLFFQYNQKEYQFKSPFAGRHYLLNSLSAILAANQTGVEIDKCIEYIQTYRGVGRRLEYLGERDGIKVYDDYGHHPTELEAVLNSLKEMKEFPHTRIVVLFQPHRYTRTRDHYLEFARVLSQADLCYILPIYSAGEDPIIGIDSNLIISSMKDLNDFQLLSGEPAKDIALILPRLQKGDLLLTIGAGNVRDWGQFFIESHTPSSYDK